MTTPDDPYGQQPTTDPWPRAPRYRQPRYEEYPGQPYAQGPHPGQSPHGGASYYQQPVAPGQGYYPPSPDQGYYPPAPPQVSPGRRQARQAPRRKKRIFLWVFLAIQALFIIWIIAGLATKPGGPSVAQQVAQQCSNGGWSPLFKSYADCTKHYGVALNDATNTGKGIGIAIIVAVWVVVDFFLGVGYGIYKLATR
jgi:hypothetical protein